MKGPVKRACVKQSSVTLKTKDPVKPGLLQFCSVTFDLLIPLRFPSRGTFEPSVLRAHLMQLRITTSPRLALPSYGFCLAVNSVLGAPSGQGVNWVVLVDRLIMMIDGW